MIVGCLKKYLVPIKQKIELFALHSITPTSKIGILIEQLNTLIPEPTNATEME
jgi:hypothetical protein